MGDGEKWGNGPGSLTPRGGVGVGGRDWSSIPNVNGPTTPGGGQGGAGMMSPSVGGGGAAAPGAGIVVTKWEHLNLKVELLRSVLKYG